MNDEEPSPLTAVEFHAALEKLSHEILRNLKIRQVEILTLDEFADRTKVGIRHVFRLKADGKLPGLFHVGSSPRVDFQEFLRRSKETSAPGIGRRPKEPSLTGGATASREKP